MASRVNSRAVRMTGRLAGLKALLAGAALAAAPATAQPVASDGAPTWNVAIVQPVPTFAEQLSALANPPDGMLGIAAVDLETGEAVSHAGHAPFPMASTVKLAIAGAYLGGVDRPR